MTDKDLQLIRDLIEEAISEFHCPPCEEEEWLTTKQTTKGLEHQRAHAPRDAPAG